MSEAEINNLFQLNYQIFLVSVDQCMQSFAQWEFLPPTVTDIYWETVKHYHDRGPPSPTRSLYRSQPASLRTSCMCSIRATRSATPTSRSACNAPKRWGGANRSESGAQYSSRRRASYKVKIFCLKNVSLSDVLSKTSATQMYHRRSLRAILWFLEKHSSLSALSNTFRTFLEFLELFKRTKLLNFESNLRKF